MKPEYEVIKKYYESLDELFLLTGNRNGSGSVGEYIVGEVYSNFVPNINKREKGYDGKIGTRRVEVKLHDSEKRTNIVIKKFEEKDKKRIQLFDDLIVVIRKGSKLYTGPYVEGEDFRIYYYKNYKGGDIGVKKLKEKEYITFKLS